MHKALGNQEAAMDIEGRVVLVTGAASGIGKATAIALAAEKPAGIAACDIDGKGLGETVGALVACGVDAEGFVLDVTDSGSVEHTVWQAIERFGRVDILINVAGIGMMGRMESLTLEDWGRAININLWGTINTNRAVWQHMLERGSGHIANVASANGIYAPIPFLAPYVTSKFGVVGLSEALMVEGRPRGITVSCICPGNVRTPIYEKTELCGFDEGARAFTNMNRVIAEEPERTAEQIIRAIRKGRFIVVTTWVARLSAFARTHLQSGWFFYTRVFAAITDRMIRRYRT
jgi:NAD(P)-dependent dehydrogenase (short-subunit alcohol dehydrogenase family)